MSALWGALDTHRLSIGAITGAVGAFLLVQLHAWPPQEDETLALFVSHKPVGEVLDTVVERGGAPLHFLLSHLVTSVWPGLTGLRLLSIAFAVASIPVVAALVARLTDRATALVATAIVAASWITLYHGLYARMYSLFLFTSTLSFIALLRALERPARRRWAAWAVAMLATLASHPYGALVLGAQGVFVLVQRARRGASLRPAALAFAAVTVLALPLWLTYRVLASRFDVGLTGGGSELGSPLEILQYLGRVAGDFTAGWIAALLPVSALALAGLVTLARRRPATAALAGVVFVVPAVGLLLARSGSTVLLESRHLIFALPFFAALVAAGLLRAARGAGPAGPLVSALGLAVLVSTQLAWGWQKTPALYAGEVPARKEAREHASAWLTATSRSDDVLFGYEPLYLDAWGKGASLGAVVVPRADARLALDALLEAKQPLGRGLWVFDASDHQDPGRQRFVIPARSPGSAYEVRAFGPFLVVRTKEPVLSAETFLRHTAHVESLGKRLGIGDAGLNFQTATNALARLQSLDPEPRSADSRSTSSS